MKFKEVRPMENTIPNLNPVTLIARVGNSYLFSHTGCFLLRNLNSLCGITK